MSIIVEFNEIYNSELGIFLFFGYFLGEIFTPPKSLYQITLVKSSAFQTTSILFNSKPLNILLDLV